MVYTCISCVLSVVSKGICSNVILAEIFDYCKIVVDIYTSDNASLSEGSKDE